MTTDPLAGVSPQTKTGLNSAAKNAAQEGESFDPYVDDFGFELECTVCGGEGDCDANADPLWDCDDNFHPCHACNGSGKRRDQRYW